MSRQRLMVSCWGGCRLPFPKQLLMCSMSSRASPRQHPQTPCFPGACRVWPGCQAVCEMVAQHVGLTMHACVLTCRPVQAWTQSLQPGLVAAARVQDCPPTM